MTWYHMGVNDIMLKPCWLFLEVKSVGAARLLWKESSLVPKTKAMEKDLKKIGVGTLLQQGIF